MHSARSRARFMGRRFIWRRWTVKRSPMSSAMRWIRARATRKIRRRMAAGAEDRAAARKSGRSVAFVSTCPGATGISREAESAQDGVNNDIWTELQDSLKVSSWTYDARVGFRRASYGRGAWSETGAQSLSLKADAQSETSKQ